MGLVEVLLCLNLIIAVTAIIVAMRCWAAYDLCREALTRSLEANIAVNALKQSTHTVVPVGASTFMEEFEKKIQGIVGPGQNDLQSNLERNGFPLDEDIEDQI
jgi:hypothetical protein